MAAITTGDVADIIQTTLNDLDKGTWTDLTGDIQEYHAMPNLLKGDKVQQKRGAAIRVNIMTDDNGQFRFTGLYEVDNYNVNDVMANGTVPWRHATFNYAFDRREEELNSGDEEKIVDLVKTRRAAAFIAAAKGLETAFWSKPATSADVTTLWGIDMYIVKNASAGFNGGNPSGFTTGAIFDSTTQSRWKNWSDQYVAVSKTDLIRRLRKAATKTEFKSPISMKEIRNGAIKRALYTNYDVIADVEELCELQNENLGNDLASKDGQAMFRKLPFMWVPQLDASSQDPVFGVDWSTFIPVFMKGENFKESKPRPHPNQHTVVVVDVDLSVNIVCYDRRRQFVVNKA